MSISRQAPSRKTRRRRRPRPPGGKRGLLLLDAGQLPGRSHAQGDDLHRVARVGVGEALPVQRVETGDKPVERLGVEAAVAQQHHQLERLAAVAHVGRKAELSCLCRDAVLVEQARALAPQLGEGAFDFRQVFRNRSQNAALREVVHDGGMENAARRERARIGWEDHPVDAELLGDRDGMQAAGAAEGQKAERARIEAFLEEAEPNRRGEACIGEGEDALSGALRVEPERARDMRLDRRPSALDIERKRAAEEEFGIETAERQVRVRHRRLRAAAAITDRPRTRAGAARTDDEAPARLDRGDRAAAGADGADLDHRQAHRQAVDLPLRHERRLGHPGRRRRRSSCRPYRCRRGSGGRAERTHAAPRALRRWGRTAEAAPAARSQPRGCTRHRSTARGGAVRRRPRSARRSLSLVR